MNLIHNKNAWHPVLSLYENETDNNHEYLRNVLVMWCVTLFILRVMSFADMTKVWHHYQPCVPSPI